MKRWLVRAGAILIVIALGTAIAIAVPRLPERGGSTTPTARVVKGPLKLTVHATGELRAGRTMTLVTPPVGGMLRIVHLVPTGVAVKKDEVIMEFDPADQQYQLEQAKSELAEAEQVIVKMKADATVQRSQDQVALLTARFDVRRAELDASGTEFVSAITPSIGAFITRLSITCSARCIVSCALLRRSSATASPAWLVTVRDFTSSSSCARRRRASSRDSTFFCASIALTNSLPEASSSARRTSNRAVRSAT